MMYRILDVYFYNNNNNNNNINFLAFGFNKSQYDV